MRDIDQVRNELKEVQKTIEQTEEEITKSKEVQEKLRKEKAELYKKLEELDRTERGIKESVYLLRQKKRRNEEDVLKLDREAIRIEEETRLRDKLKNQGEILDIITIGAPWREWAYDYQLKGAKQLAIAGRGILGDKRGLGKTLTSIVWLDMVKAKKAIIFVPKEAAKAFRKQMPRFAPHRPFFDFVSQPKRIREVWLNHVLKALDEWTLLVNLESWRREGIDGNIISKLIELDADAVVIDEAHTIKDPRTSYFKGVKKVVYPSDHSDELGVRHVLPMSGTTYLNYPDELWSLLHLVDRRAWPAKKYFRDDYLMQDYRTGRYVFNPYNKAQEKLLNELGLRYLQRNRHDAGIVIPPQEIQEHEIEWDVDKYADQYSAYKDLEIKSAVLLQGMEDKEVFGVEGLALLTRLRQMITWPAGIQLKDPDTEQILFRCDVEQSIKIDFAVDLLEQIKEEEDRCVLFSQFREPLRVIQQRLTDLGISAAILDGSTSDRDRDRIANDFDIVQTPEGSDYKWDVVLANYKVGGQSLDFTAARQMIMLDEERNPGRADQARGRIDRIGQTKETVVHVIRVLDTVDISLMKRVNDYKAQGLNEFEATVKAATLRLLGDQE